MSSELFTSDGKRKYLTADEREAFIAAAQAQPRAEVRTFCEALAQTGCRISEALELTAERIDLSAKAVTFRTLKQREVVRYRAVPIPESLLDALELVHRIRRAQRRKGKGKNAPLWPWGRTQAYKHVKAVMKAAGISGPHASPKGLRHGFGVKASEETRHPRLVQKWLGHRDLKTTAIYMDALGDEERAIAARMWNG